MTYRRRYLKWRKWTFPKASQLTRDAQMPPRNCEGFSVWCCEAPADPPLSPLSSRPIHPPIDIERRTFEVLGASLARRPSRDGGALRLKRRGAQGSAEGPWPFYAKRPLSPPEQVLYHRLVARLPDHIVLAQVQVSRVLGVKKGFNHHEWNNRINRLSYDFVVCGKDSTVLAAIELGRQTHEAASRTQTNKKKTRRRLAAGVPIIRWHVKSIPDEGPSEPRLPSARPPLHRLRPLRVEGRDG